MNEKYKRAFICAFQKCGGQIIWYLFGMGLSMIIAILYRVSLEPLIYAASLVSFLWILYFLWTCYRQYNIVRVRGRIKDGVTTAWTELKEPASLLEEDYQEMVRRLGSHAEGLAIKRQNEKKEMADYYAVWIHQIKTPIAVMKLLLNRMDSEEGSALSSELFRVEQYVEMALNYTRLDEDANDLVITDYALDNLIRQAIRKHASQFIFRKLRLSYEETNLHVVTDQKWFLCILDQILSNAVKYTAKGGITITVEEEGKDILLRITDTGIGIAPEDIPRIFDKGFTGLNGRMEHKSTGIGLYICKKAADKLKIGLRAESKPGKGSTFTLVMENPEKVKRLF